MSGKCPGTERGRRWQPKAAEVPGPSEGGKREESEQLSEVSEPVREQRAVRKEKKRRRVNSEEGG